MSVNFQIENNVPIPKREVEFGPRGSQYPLKEMSKGQSFRVDIVDHEGNWINDEDKAKKKASQKQSYFSALGRKLDIKVVTRYFPAGESEDDGPCLRVWHNGPRPVTEEAAPEDEVPTADELPEDELDL